MDRKIKLGWFERVLVVIAIVMVSGGLAEVTRGLLAIAHVMSTGHMPS